MRCWRFIQAYAFVILSFYAQVAFLAEPSMGPLREGAEILREELLSLQELVPPIFFTIPNTILQIFMEKLAIPLGFGNPLAGLMIQMQRPTGYLGFGDGELPGPNKSSASFRSSKRSTEELAEKDSLQALFNFTDKLSATLGGILNIEDTLKDLQNLPSSVSQDLTSFIEIYGDALVESVRHGNSAISALVQQLIAPIEDDGLPFFLPLITDLDSMKNDSTGIMEKFVSDSEQLIQHSSNSQRVSAKDSLESRQRIVAYAKSIGKLYGLESSYATFAGAFVDEFLIPAGVAIEVADMMDAAWEVLNGDAVSIKNMFQPNLIEDLGDEANVMLQICSTLGDLLGTKRFHASIARSFSSFILVPLNIMRPVASLLAANSLLLRKFYHMRSVLQRMAILANSEPLTALFLPKVLATMKARAGKMFFSGLLESNDVSREDLLNMAISKLIHYGQIIDKGFSLGAAATFLYRADDTTLTNITSALNHFMDDLSNVELCNDIKNSLLHIMIDEADNQNVKNIISDVENMCLMDDVL